MSVCQKYHIQHSKSSVLSMSRSKALKKHQLLFYINKYPTASTKILISSVFKAYHGRQRSYILSRFPKETCLSLLTPQYHKQMDQSCKPSLRIPYIPSLYVFTWMHSLSAGTLLVFFQTAAVIKANLQCPTGDNVSPRR